MKTALISFLLSITIIVSGQKNDSIKYIKYGHFAGECYGYCRVRRSYDKMNLVVNGNTSVGLSENKELRQKQDSSFIIRSIDSVGTETIEHPTDHLTIVTSKLKVGEWYRMVNSINLKDFYLLPAITGCPDCNDGGGEWIEIVCTNSSHKITFEAGPYDSAVTELMQLINPYK